jgi:hypothetical protein
MGKPDWGKRYTCHKCGKSFYDLGKPDSRCPACGANPAKATSKGGSKSKIQRLMPKEEVDSDQPANGLDNEPGTGKGGENSEDTPEAISEES